MKSLEPINIIDHSFRTAGGSTQWREEKYTFCIDGRLFKLYMVCGSGYDVSLEHMTTTGKYETDLYYNNNYEDKEETGIYITSNCRQSEFKAQFDKVKEKIFDKAIVLAKYMPKVMEEKN